MEHKQSSFMITVLIVLALSMMWTVPVLADGDEPQNEEPTVSETQPVDEPVSVKEEPLTEETAPASETEPEPVLAEEEPSPAPEATPFEQLPEDTTIVVVDENGDPLPLVTQEAADAVTAMPDPQWCPVGAMPGSATCSPSFIKFTGAGGLLEWLAANDPSKAGVIWIEASYDSSVAGDTTEVGFDGSILLNMANFALTINGGWNGPGTNTMNPLDPSEFNVPFQVFNWTGAVTLNNLLITGATGAATTITVNTDGNITVNNVDVLDNTTDAGAELNNTSGLGNVVVNDSTFNNNTGGGAWGLRIFSNGTVTLKNITANGNSGSGMDIMNNMAPTPKAVTLTGFNQFLHNGWDGISVFTDGQTTLSNITAEGNGGNGAFLFSASPPNSAGVTIKGASSFNNNGWDGLYIYTFGAVMLSNITANDNGWDPNRDPATSDGEGGYYYDASGKGAFILAHKAITLTGVNTFNGNASTGLYADALGLITVSNLTADGNGCDPLKDLNDTICAGAFLLGAGINLTGYGNFSGNFRKGLHAENAYIPSMDANVGAITLNNIFAKGNGTDGLYAWTSGNMAYNVSLLGMNTFLNNGSRGAAVESNGAVTLNNITSNGNFDFGVYVDNTNATSAKPVVFVGLGTYVGNSNGIVVLSKGAITTNGLMVLDNGNNGVLLDNCLLNAGACDAFVGQAVNINGINTIANNGASGLFVQSRGTITISSLTTSNNAFTGVYVDNRFTNSVGTITFKSYLNSFSNGTSGVIVYSRGVVVMANVHADSNGDNGLYLNNDYVNTTQSNVTITGTNSFSYNGLSGLLIDTYGVVTLNNIFANGNGEYGAEIDNYRGDAIAARNVTLTGVNVFNGNANQDGLKVTSQGAIVVNKVNASFNGGKGAYLDNKWGLVSQPVTIVGYGVFNYNAVDGLMVFSHGAVTLANLTANNNAGEGVWIVNSSLTTTPLTTALSVNVTITGVNNFNANAFNGLSIYSDGVITLNNVTASYNGLTGLTAYNTQQPGGSVAKGFTLNGWNTFIGNDDTGLVFNISGNVVLNRVVSSYNSDGAGPYTGSGVVGVSGGTITLICASLNGNEGYGFDLSAAGMITLKGVFTHGNTFGSIATGVPVIVTRTCTLP